MSKDKLEFGNVAKDVITGFKGVVIARTKWRHNCDRLTLQPQEAKEGVPIESKSFDEPDLVYVKHSDIETIPLSRPDVRVELGDTVKDRITGAEGVAIAHTAWNNGCSRFTVQPLMLDKEGAPAGSYNVDEKDLKLVKRAKPEHAATPEPRAAGGPRPEPRR